MIESQPAKHEKPLVVFACFIAVGLQVFVMLESTEPEPRVDLNVCGGDYAVRGKEPALISSCRRSDYRPTAPADGVWCGVRLEDRDPVRGDSFPTIETSTASSP